MKQTLKPKNKNANPHRTVNKPGLIIGFFLGVYLFLFFIPMVARADTQTYLTEYNNPYKNFTYHGIPAFALSYKNGGTIVLSCNSDSMHLVFNCNDKLILIPANNNISVGDIVAYLGGGKWRYDYIIHRVIEVGYKNNKPFYITKGDNNKYIDPWIVYPYQIKYKVVGKFKTYP